MEVTNEELKEIFPYSTEKNRAKYLPYINRYADLFEVNTPDRMAVFLAQVGHESGQLRYSEEIASGAAYEGRRDLGNTMRGDGKRFKGRGLIQVTGRANYTFFNTWLHHNKYLSDEVSILDTPDIVSKDSEIAVLSAFWYWSKHKINTLADRPE